MAERREKVILSLACFLRCDFLSFNFSTADLIGDVACDLGVAADVSLVVAQRSQYNFGFKS